MINCSNNKLLNIFTLYFDIHNLTNVHGVYKVMTGKHTLLLFKNKKRSLK